MMLGTMTLNAYAECHYTECHNQVYNAQCYYAECSDAECHGAGFLYWILVCLLSLSSTVAVPRLILHILNLFLNKNAITRILLSTLGIH